MDPLSQENKKDVGPQNDTRSDGFVIEPLRTYEQDVRNVVANQNVSVVKMALAEQQRQEDQGDAEKPGSPESKRNILIISVSVGLILAALVAIGGTYYFVSYAKKSLTSQGSGAAFIASDSSHTIILIGNTKTELAQKIASEENSLANGVIERVFFHAQGAPATSTLSTDDFLNILQAKAPSSLVESLYPEFAFGFYGANRVPFLIFETNSYDQAYANMLLWEPYMRGDFEDILYSTEFENQLPPSPASVAASSTSSMSSTTQTTATSSGAAGKNATSTAAAPVPASAAASDAQNSLPFPTSFQDLVVNNQDTRALYNRNGQLLVLYGFVDKRYIVITRDTEALNEIYNRLRENELSR